MFDRFFGNCRSHKQNAHDKAAKRTAWLGFESLVNRDLFTIDPGPGISVNHLGGIYDEKGERQHFTCN